MSGGRGQRGTKLASIAGESRKDQGLRLHRDEGTESTSSLALGGLRLDPPKRFQYLIPRFNPSFFVGFDLAVVPQSFMAH